MSSKTAYSLTYLEHFDKVNLEALTRATMLELMKTAKFKVYNLKKLNPNCNKIQELWMNMAMEIEKENEANIEDELKSMESEEHLYSPARLNPPKVAEYIQQKTTTPPPVNPLLDKSFRELAKGLVSKIYIISDIIFLQMLAIETFIRGAQMAILCASPAVVRTFNRDAAQLYSVSKIVILSHK